jgi:hypothetical protein
MKFVKCALFISLICFIFYACKTNKNEILNAKKMEDVLVDIYIAEAYAQYLKNDTLEVSKPDSLKKYMSVILGKHTITQKKFSESMQWYKDNPTEFDTIYSHVFNKITALHYKQKDSVLHSPIR